MSNIAEITKLPDNYKGQNVFVMQNSKGILEEKILINV